MRTGTALAVGISAALALGCSDHLAAPTPPAGAASPQRGGTLHLASIGDIRTLDPAAVSDALAGASVQMIFAGLVDFDLHGNVIPDLARSFEVAPDGLSVTFRLREGVRFHDGNELTADDVKRSIERALHPDTPCPSASYFDRIAGFDDYRDKKAKGLTGIEVGGRYLVTVRLKARDAMLLPLFALQTLRPVCPTAGARYSDTWLPCGTGPFRLLPGNWDRGRSVTLVRNENFYVPGLPHLDAVVFSYNVPSLSQRFKLEATELDVLRDFTQADLIRFTTDPRWKPFGEYEPERAIFGEAMNTELPPFDNVEVRRAVAAAIDRSAYELIRPGLVVATGKVVPRPVPGYSENVEGQKYDLAAALEHMRRAGYAYDPATGQGGYPKRIEYLAFRPGFGEYSSQLLQQQLARIGIRIDIRLVSFPTYLTLSQRRGRIQMSPQGWNQDYPDALDFYDSLFSSRMIADESASNAAFYKNPELDGIIDRAREELDPVARQRLYDRAQAIVRDDAPWAMTYGYRWHVVRQPYVKDLALHPTWVYEVRSTWFDRAKHAIAARAGIFGELLGFSTARRVGHTPAMPGERTP
jgi:ABC-type transport system substrate-binding protein